MSASMSIGQGMSSGPATTETTGSLASAGPIPTTPETAGDVAKKPTFLFDFGGKKEATETTGALASSSFLACA